MTAPSPSGGPSALRIGGLALIGVAVVTAIVGLVTLATGGGPESSQTAAPSAASSSTAPEAPAPTPAPGTEAPTPLPTSSDTVPLPAFPTSPEGTAPAPGAPAPGAPGAPAPAPAPGSAPPAAAPPAVAAPAPRGGGNGDRTTSGDTAVARAPLRVYNNSRIEGLAARAAEDFRRGGWEVTEISAYGEGTIPVTTVYYRPGTDEEAPAMALGAQFGLRVNPRFEGLRNATPGIIVIVTREYGTQ